MKKGKRVILCGIPVLIIQNDETPLRQIEIKLRNIGCLTDDENFPEPFNIDEEDLRLFAGIQKSDAFTKEAVYEAFSKILPKKGDTL